MPEGPRGLAAPVAEWVRDGNVQSDGEIAILRPSAADSAGAIAWPEVGQFEASFDVRLEPGAPPGEGLVYTFHLVRVAVAS